MKVFNNLDVAGDIRDMMFSKGDSEGKGFGVYTDPDGNRVVEADILVGRLGARFKELKVYQTEYMGGDFILSPACLTVSEVVQEDSYCRCFFDTKDGSVLNDFVVGDGAFCQRYSPHDYKYYWMRVIAVGTDYIDLSMDDRDSGGYLPAEGDVVIQLGNATDKSRQGAIFISTEGDDAPSFTICGEIDGFTLEDKNLGGWKYDTDREEMVLYGFGSFVFGSKDGTSGISYDKKTGKVVVSGDMNIGSGSSGLENFSEWSGKQALITKAQTAADKAQSTANAVSSAADKAQSTANAASSAADNAQQSAARAQQTATDARAKADEVEQSLISTAETLDQAISDAEKAAKDYSDEGKAALQESIDELNESKASIDDVYTKSVADGLINSAEERAGKKAQEVADAAKTLAEENAKAYADDVADEAEKAAIADAETKLAYAKKELEDAISEVEEIATTADAATRTLDTKIADIETGLTESVAEINARLDGVVENYFEEGVPSTTDYPVSKWKEASENYDYELINHVGDTYTNIEEYVDETTPDAGKSWRWCWCEDSSVADKIEVTDKDGNTRYLHWHPIADSDAVKALLEASRAKTAADGKSRTFVVQPVPPYKAGDLWVQGSTGDIMRCKDGVDRTSGSYTASDWEIASKYTDDTAAKNAQKAADDAQTTATTALTAAQAAKQVTDNLNNDLVFSLTEKRSIRSKLKDINPSETPAISVNTFMLGAIESKGSGSWSKVTDETDANYGWYASNMHSDSSYAIAKVNFTVVEAGSSMTVHIMSRAELSYDYTMLGDIDTELSEPTYETEGIVAETSDNQEEDISHTFTNLTVGEHFFCVYYYKDGSDDASLDNGYFKIDDALFLKGSLGDYLALCKERGISGSDATAKATSLFAYLHGKGVWNNTDTVLNESDDFRNRVYGLFQDYYAAITGIQQEITKSDYEYLTEAFGKSQNLNVEGVVMSQLMAVRNEDKEVEAVFNGSDFAEDTSHGKLILAGGIPEETSSGSTDLEERTKEAATRIYEDGHVETNDIEAVDGTFSGALKLKFQTVTAGTTHTLTESDSSSIYLPVGYMTSTELVLPNNDVFDGILLNVFCYPRMTKDEAISKVSGTILCPGQLGTGTNVVSEIEFPNGGFAQFTYSALKQEWVLANLQGKASLITDVREITSNSTADEKKISLFDRTVIVDNSSAITLTLPSNPPEGQTYRVIHVTASTVTWNGNGNTVTNVATGTTSTSFSARRSVVLTYYDRVWYVEYIQLSN